MTLLSWMLSFFPALVMVGAIASFLSFCIWPNGWSLLLLLVILYGLPPLVHRLHQWRYPITEGISYLQGKIYSPWWGSHQIQAIYIAFPVLETALRLVPGLFSCWLRLWGAKVGKQVYWTPKLEISDRSLLDIGDRVVFGYQVGLYAHAIKPRRDNLMLYVKRIRIGNDVFLSGGVQIGPGVAIADGTFVPTATHLYPNQLFNPPI
ncbi:MAG: acyltransferase [Thainema sp.]